MKSNTDVLLKVEIHTKEETKNLIKYMQEFNIKLENIPRRNESHSLEVQIDDSESILTAHSNNSDNPIVKILIIETPINYANNQIIITSVHHTPSKEKIKNSLISNRIFVFKFLMKRTFNSLNNTSPSYQIKRTFSKLIDVTETNETKTAI